jgi:hypothetical protein
LFDGLGEGARSMIVGVWPVRCSQCASAAPATPPPLIAIRMLRFFRVRQSRGAID